MNILLLGSGGREHALAWKMAASPHCTQLFIAPGNPGTAQLGTNLQVSVTDFPAIRDLCIQHSINLLVVGPEEPLVKGIYDYFQEEESLREMIVVGPSRAAAQLEGSKSFSKHFMQRHGIPTAAYAEFTADNFEEGQAYIKNQSLPIVVKADGLAAGKGVVVATSYEEALGAFDQMIRQQQFGEAGSKVVIEAFLKGIEVSVFVLTDGEHYQIIGHAKDYKRVGEGDTGPNTGGMGCISPVPFMDDTFWKKVTERIIEPTITGIAKENLIYKGFIFFGLMNVAGDPWVIEYNCRMGDPETEVVMPLLQTDLVALLAAMDNGTLGDANISFFNKQVATVVAVSGGYPGQYPKNLPIYGLANTGKGSETLIFQAGTAASDTGQLVTSGGRVLAVTSYGETLTEAVQHSLKELEQIHFEGMFFRKDIGYEFS
ncbi:MAG: phosphoribosylamine--glycine ligase [Chitinophagia bacterium]|jgi:phosphoribosylamine--glycine ligase